MRFFMALTATVLGDALAWIAGLAAFGVAVWQMIVHGVPISVAVLGAAALLIGAPTLFGVGYTAYDRACAEFGVERVPPKGDSGLGEKIRRRMADDIKGE